jgi:hypothetical protein
MIETIDESPRSYIDGGRGCISNLGSQAGWRAAIIPAFPELNHTRGRRLLSFTQPNAAKFGVRCLNGKNKPSGCLILYLPTFPAMRESTP